ncbi:thioredoxin [Acidiferrobacter thiooxydans]|jgi:thioredoxin 1|uniref:Thioredoxin n=1 Tax=Acidiferrobacter thiooxydans TaxID=163359 RepID=A0A1C2FY82_9GAMM|nr:thioredoxin [Acidiferrobacter thiooxydans]MDA8191618.1 thioredoxin [Gammaproteobacteria bacterium]RCN56749.1 thioredoxin [Acidiferrobacter thiooxydans]UEN99427.1 thioredoxin [Acidiferrobacter thiooxydans]
MATVEATKANFEQLVDTNPFVIVDFWAPWCAPCRAFGPIFEEASEQHKDIVFAKINTEAETELAAHFQVRSIPTLMIFRDQIILFAQPGSLPKKALEEIIGQARAVDMDAVRREVAEEAEHDHGCCGHDHGDEGHQH